MAIVKCAQFVAPKPLRRRPLSAKFIAARCYAYVMKNQPDNVTEVKCPMCNNVSYKGVLVCTTCYGEGKISRVDYENFGRSTPIDPSRVSLMIKLGKQARADVTTKSVARKKPKGLNKPSA